MVAPEAEKVVPVAVVGESLARHAAAVDDEEDEKKGGVAGRESVPMAVVG